MISNVKISVPLEDFGKIEVPVGDYFQICNEMNGEYLIIQNDDSTFFFICTIDSDIDYFCKLFDWYIVSKDKFNDNLFIGIGLADKYAIDGEVYCCADKTTLNAWRDILLFTFASQFIRQFFPYTNHFKGKKRFDDAICFYIHDYYPVSHNKDCTAEQKKITNLIFRFKEGKSSVLVAKLFSLAISRMPFFHEAKNPILIPIPASTRERHQQRFAKFNYLLAKHLKIQDGYKAIWINKDREQFKGQLQQNKISNLTFNKEFINGKDVFLVDDILTTGQGFIQTKRILMKLGANNVVGLFLGKTVNNSRQRDVSEKK